MANESPDESTWTCRVCTFVNENNDGGKEDICTMCENRRRAVRTSNASLRQSICLADAFRRGSSYDGQRASISKLCNMSFAAWESDRQPWVCKTCTFENGPRYLMCGGCGIAEGAISVSDDSLISSGLEGMSLGSAQKYLFDAIHRELDDFQEENLRKERLVELLDEEIKAEAYQRALSSYADIEQAEENCKIEKLRKHIETLEKLQDAELEEHDNMAFTIELWRDKLNAEPNARELQQLIEQEEMLEKLVKEWTEREKEIEQMRLRLEGNRASI
ncbi:hypothetical protein HJC23_008287 [Cyclotella cryptica]|uniref:RanBP2-type domain-containing protein n=1 Tax=Cyclotella cryptica TaxID=29204 RepID=A0ABD3PCQ1_9STRA